MGSFGLQPTSSFAQRKSTKCCFTMQDVRKSSIDATIVSLPAPALMQYKGPNGSYMWNRVVQYNIYFLQLCAPLFSAYYGMDIYYEIEYFSNVWLQFTLLCIYSNSNNMHLPTHKSDPDSDSIHTKK
jgi:hypothetical protein